MFHEENSVGAACHDAPFRGEFRDGLLPTSPLLSFSPVILFVLAPRGIFLSPGDKERERKGERNATLFLTPVTFRINFKNEREPARVYAAGHSALRLIALIVTLEGSKKKKKPAGRTEIKKYLYHFRRFFSSFSLSFFFFQPSLKNIPRSHYAAFGI